MAEVVGSLLAKRPNPYVDNQNDQKREPPQAAGIATVVIVAGFAVIVAVAVLAILIQHIRTERVIEHIRTGRLNAEADFLNKTHYSPGLHEEINAFLVDYDAGRIDKIRRRTY